MCKLRAVHACIILCLISFCLIAAEDDSCPEEYPWDNARLPATAHPIHYKLLIHPNLTTFTFSGRVDITFNVTEDSDFVVLNAVDLIIDSVILRKNTQVIPTTWLLCPPGEQLAVLNLNLAPHLREGELYNITVIFRGDLTDELRGLYRSSYKTESGEKKYMAVTQFSPTDARRMFPCWDEPLFKATFQTSVLREPGKISLSNTPLIGTKAITSHLVRDDFETTLRMSTYLVAVVVCDFPKRTKLTARGVEVSVYAPQSQINQTSFALDVAVDALEFHETYLKIPYPLKKLDILAVGDFAFGAMENWGLMTFRDTIILSDPEKWSIQNEDETVGVIAHEIGHQWFGNLVTMKWWSDLWLKEGFASFLQTYAASKMRPDWGMMDIFPQIVINTAFNLDSLKNTHPVYVPVDESADIRGIFDAISYSKGASIIFMLLNILGEENLAAGLRDYLTLYQYSNAEGSEFWRVLAQHAKHLESVNLDSTAEKWTLQAGYPYIEVSANATTLILHQERFYNLRELADKDTTPSVWTIPFTFLTDTGENRLVWFNSTDFAISLTAPIKQWFKANVNGSGFYRVLYTPDTWRTFAHRLKQSYQAFSTRDRTNLLMDAFAFVETGQLNIGVALELAEYVQFEMEFGPWNAAMGAFENIETIYMETPLCSLFRAYVRSLLEPVYKGISWNLPSGHTERRFFAKILSASCHYDVGNCKERAMEIFKNWQRQGTRIPADLLSLVINAAILENTDDYWDAVWGSYMDSNTPSEKKTFLSALCQTPNKEKLFGLLNASLDGTVIRGNLLPTVATEISHNPQGGASLLWQFTKDNWPRIFEIAGGTAVLGSYLRAALTYFSEEADLEDVKAFFSQRDVDGAQRALDETLELVQINIQWRKINEADLERFLKNARLERYITSSAYSTTNFTHQPPYIK